MSKLVRFFFLLFFKHSGDETKEARIMQCCSFHSHAESEESPSKESESVCAPPSPSTPGSIKFPPIKSVSSEQIVFE